MVSVTQEIHEGPNKVTQSNTATTIRGQRNTGGVEEAVASNIEKHRQYKLD